MEMIVRATRKGYHIEEVDYVFPFLFVWLYCWHAASLNAENCDLYFSGSNNFCR